MVIVGLIVRASVSAKRVAAIRCRCDLTRDCHTVRPAMHQGARAHERHARDRLALLTRQGLHRRRVDVLHVRALRRLFQKAE